MFLFNDENYSDQNLILRFFPTEFYHCINVMKLNQTEKKDARKENTLY